MSFDVKSSTSVQGKKMHLYISLFSSRMYTKILYSPLLSLCLMAPFIFLCFSLSLLFFGFICSVLSLFVSMFLPPFWIAPHLSW